MRARLKNALQKLEASQIKQSYLHEQMRISGNIEVRPGFWTQSRHYWTREEQEEAITVAREIHEILSAPQEIRDEARYARAIDRVLKLERKGRERAFERHG